MAAVALVGDPDVSDRWRRSRPVLQLIPNRTTQRATSGSREGANLHGFPTLAVTRGKDEKKHRNMTLRSSSLSSDSSEPTEHRKIPTSKSTRYNKPMNMAPVSYSVQDLNKQMAYRARRLQPEARVSSASSFASEIVAASKLPKPVSRTADVYNFLNQNGFLRSPLTPGEMDLKRFKNACAKEQAKRNKKKFKLNVKELPRSTTPINDHDPDKLNMKQVIAFLQDQPQKPFGGQIQFSSAAEKRVLVQSRGIPGQTSPFANFAEKQPTRSDRCFSEPVSFSAQNIACQSATSLRTTPPRTKRVQSSTRCQGARSEKECSESQVRPYSDIPGRDNRFQTFLSLEPNGLGLTTTPQYKTVDKGQDDIEEPQILPIAYRSNKFTNVKCNDSTQHKCDNDASLTVKCSGIGKNCEKSDSVNESVKADIEVNKSLNKNPSDSGFSDISQSDTKQDDSSKSTDSGAIRVPVLNDFHDDWDLNSENDLEDTELQNTSSEERAEFHPAEGSQEFESKAVSCPKLDFRVPFGAKRVPQLSGVFRYIPSYKDNRNMKRINVEVPHGNGPEVVKSDVIKLTMRQDSAITRHTSYMSDIAKNEKEGSEVTYLPIISIQDVHGSMVAENPQPIRERTTIHPATVSMTFNRKNNKENTVGHGSRSVEFERIRRRKKLHRSIE